MTDDLSQRQINDGLYLYKRARSTRWQARIKRTDNEWFAMSCGTADFEAAKSGIILMTLAPCFGVG